MLRKATPGFLGVLVGAAVVAMACWQWGLPPTKVVRAGRFEVVDSRGNIRAALGLLPYDVKDMPESPQLSLYDEGGLHRATLRFHEGMGPHLILWGEGGGMRVELSAATQSSTLMMKDGIGIQRFELWVPGSGVEPSLELTKGLRTLWKVPPEPSDP